MQTQHKPKSLKEKPTKRVSFQDAPKQTVDRPKKRSVIKLRVLIGTEFSETLHARVEKVDKNGTIHAYIVSDPWVTHKHDLKYGSLIEVQACQVWGYYESVSYHGNKYFVAEENR